MRISGRESLLAKAMNQWIDSSDVEFEATRSGGPGGQNANMRSTAIRLRASVIDLPLTDQQKRWLQDHLPPKNRFKDDGFMVENSEGRSQHENRKRALRQANEEIREALEKGRRARQQNRRSTKPRGSSSGRSGGGSRDIHEEQKKELRSETTDDLLEQALEEDPDLVVSQNEV